MNILAIILFVSVISPYCTACSSVGSQSSSRNKFINEVPFAKTPSSTLNFTAGDIIGCNINMAASHVFLASTNSTVIYIEGDTEEVPFKTRIAEKQFDLVASVYEKCNVITKFYDERYAADCKGKPYPTADVLRRARSSLHTFVRKYTSFCNWKCNSEHWVSAWRYGTSWTLQTPGLLASKFRGDDCEAPGLQKCNVEEETV